MILITHSYKGEKTWKHETKTVKRITRTPFAGYYQDNPSELIEIGEKLGDLLGKKALEA
jgi:flavodoxin